MNFATHSWLGERKFKFLFPSGTTAHIPQWGSGEFPPLSPRAAARSALAFLNTVLPNSGGSLRSYTLGQAWGPRSEDCYWYYSIEFQVPDPEDGAADDSLVQIPVLLNGVVPPHLVVDENRG